MAEAAPATAARTAALIGVPCMTIALATLPVLVGFGLVPFAGSLAAGMGSLAAVAGGVELAAVGGGLVARFESGRGPMAAPASVDYPASQPTRAGPAQGG